MDDLPATLVRTKLTVPAGGTHTVRRLRLERLLTAGLQRSLITVVAPAGYGKSALVSRWATGLSRRGTHVGWVTLDAKDDDPFRFWTYVSAALGLPAAAAGWADVVTSPDPEEFLVPLTNHLAALDDELVLVLDDVHVLTDRRIHAGLRFLLRGQSPLFHLVVLSRDAPTYLTVRRHGLGEVAELGARDLAFDPEDTEALLDRLAVPLGGQARARLHQHFGGWAVALSLTVLWAAGRPDPDAAVLSMTAADGTLADFVTSEVLEQLPLPTRRFLTVTSILPRLTGPLCDAVTGGSAGGDTLRRLERRGLFVEALDEDGQWFSYHPVFQEILQQLARQHPGTVREAHADASSWFATHGLPEEAIEHAVAAQDWPRLKQLLLGEALSIGSHRPLPVLEAWLSRVPPAMLRSPFFLLLQAFMWGQTGRTEEARDVLAQARRVLGEPDVQAELPALQGLLLAVGSALARLDGDLAEASHLLALTETELDRAGVGGTDEAEMAWAVAANGAAGVMVWHGQARQAELLLLRVRRTTAPQRMRMHVNRLSLDAFVLAERGRLGESDAVAAEALRRADDLGIRDLFQTTPAQLAQAKIAVERGEHAAAAAVLDRLAPLVERHHDRGPRVLVAAGRSRLAGLDGDATRALDLLDAARATPGRWAMPPALAALLDEQEVRLCLDVGDLTAARTVLTRLEATDPATPVAFLARAAAAARVLAAEGRSREATAAFVDVASSPAATGYLPRRVEALVEAAVTAAPSAAPRWLRRALVAAQPDALHGPFLRQGRQVRPLLLRMEGEAGLGLLAFRRRLLLLLDVPAPAAAPSGPTLSGRELTVVRLLGGALPQAQVAEALGLSANTLKTHVRHLYRKLGASTRAEAVQRAADLGLFDGQG